ncbi:hypothetical protein EVAR_29251_1 [Eumeta japonica]|uniref:Uncharacterized protein n=1 Tax=Eumeta variegata TaxID=151549 RepID=A0A4C1VJ36_EUMVA|nr:hypothetical protein EVAR_29251_1 [Eumeta japonica]
MCKRLLRNYRAPFNHKQSPLAPRRPPDEWSESTSLCLNEQAFNLGETVGRLRVSDLERSKKFPITLVSNAMTASVYLRFHAFSTGKGGERVYNLAYVKNSLVSSSVVKTGTP